MEGLVFCACVTEKTEEENRNPAQVNAVLKQLELLFGQRDEREGQCRKAAIDAQMRKIVYRLVRVRPSPSRTSRVLDSHAAVSF